MLKILDSDAMCWVQPAYVSSEAWVFQQLTRRRRALVELQAVDVYTGKQWARGAGSRHTPELVRWLREHKRELTHCVFRSVHQGGASELWLEFPTHLGAPCLSHLPHWGLPSDLPLSRARWYLHPDAPCEYQHVERWVLSI